MSKIVSTALVGALLFLVSACGGATRVVVDGHSVNARAWQRDREVLQARASFDMHCPASQLSFRLLDVHGDFVRQVGVTGCGRQLVYVDPMMNSMWVANTEGRSAQ
jgi:hypothetical protein